MSHGKEVELTTSLLNKEEPMDVFNIKVETLV